MNKRTDKAVWYRHDGPQGDVVVSTRVRLARNLPQYPFPNSMTDTQKQEVSGLAREAVANLSESLREIRMQNLPRRDALSLVERHVISPAFAEAGDGATLFLSEDESVSVMVNEEDHLRLQVLCAGLDLEEAYRRADEMDTVLDARLHFAFDTRLGYLTQCPTNLGTAMRASVMLHLPALQESKTIAALAGTVSKLGLTIRGLYGEGTRADGAMYQLSNQVTLGISEREAMENLRGVVMQIVAEERRAREQICAQPRYEDKIWRSLGILRTARLLSHEECVKLLSLLRIGVYAGLLPEIAPDTVSALYCDVQPATLMCLAGEDLDPQARDVRRAELVRERL